MGRGIKKRGSGMEAPQEQNLLQVPARRQVSEANDHTFWHDQGGKCNANKTRMKQMNWRNLPSCVPFILLDCLSTTDHTTQEDKATAGSTCRREAHLMPSYLDPAPRSPWKAHAAKRRGALANMCSARDFPLGFGVAFAPEGAGEGGAWTRIFLSWREGRIRYYRVKECTGGQTRY